MLANPLTVLCVDDEASVLRGLERTLKKRPYRVLTAGGAGPALEILNRDHIDVLISDVDMPEMSGLELVQIARRDHPDTVRMLLSSQTSFHVVMTAVNEGAIAKYLSKPWDDEQIFATIDQAELELTSRRALAAQQRAADRHRMELARHLALFPGLDQRAAGIHTIRLEALIAAGLASEIPELRALLP
jgi:YesN/AraC family two-component response regulator